MWAEMKTLNARVNDTNVRIERLGEDLGARIDKTNERLDRTNERLEQAIDRLDGVERRQSESEIRFLTELASSKAEPVISALLGGARHGTDAACIGHTTT